MIKNSCTFLLICPERCLLLPCLGCRSLSPICSLHSQGGVGAAVEKGEKGDPVCIFPPLWHLPHCCIRVINRGVLPQGQPGAAGTSEVKGQKVSDTGVRCSTHSGCICASLYAHRKKREEVWRKHSLNNIHQNSLSNLMQNLCLAIPRYPESMDMIKFKTAPNTCPFSVFCVEGRKDKHQKQMYTSKQTLQQNFHERNPPSHSLSNVVLASLSLLPPRFSAYQPQPWARWLPLTPNCMSWLHLKH